MSEYWKSLPRKFCDTCKCWFADNKASIEFHEKGKRHQENVQKRINDIQKRGIKEYKKMKDLENTMDKIEKAALAAYKKDLQNGAELSSQHEASSEIAITIKKNTDFEPPKNVKKQKPIKVKALNKGTHIAKDKILPNVSQESSKKWYEGITDEGYKYYWNVENSESSWEAPEEGYVSLEEQGIQPQKASEDIKDNIEEASATTAEESDSEDASDKKKYSGSSSAYGPQPKVDPYGQWVTVGDKVEEPVDLQLPKPSENIIEAYISIPAEDRKLKFKEKVIGQLANSDPNEEVTFKKRKLNGFNKRNARQRTIDD